MAFPPLIFKRRRLKLLDQRLLPRQEKWLECESAEEVVKAIREMVIRGAPAIGIAGAYGVYLGIRDFKGSRQNFDKVFREKAQLVRDARPTAVNLPWAVERIQRKVAAQKNSSVAALKTLILEEAEKIQKEDEALCRLIGRHGSKLFKERQKTWFRVKFFMFGSGGDFNVQDVIAEARFLVTSINDGRQ